jgi:hypothetical protein
LDGFGYVAGLGLVLFLFVPAAMNQVAERGTVCYYRGVLFSQTGGGAMSSLVTSLPLPEVSPEIQTFAEEQGVAAYLPAVLALTRRIFPNWPIKVLLEDDPEIANDWHIVLEVQVPEHAAAETLLALDEQWVEKIFTCCPSTHVCIFRLGMA